MDDLLTASAVELARRIRAREASSEQVVRAHLERIAEVNPRLHAVVQLSPTALDEARAADAAMARDEPAGPFHGVPFTVKDWIETEGLVCAAGFAARAAHRPRQDATAVARLRAAGAILLGKTNVNEGSEVHPRPLNPHDPARTPGASSSGEATIIAARGSPMGLASDSGGSIRWPAHCCGVAALKPTTGRVPLTGHFPRIGHLSDPRTVIGPMARSAADLALLLAVIAGEDPRDPGSVPAPLGDPAAVPLRGLRIAMHTAFPGAQPTPETVATVEAAAQALAARGAIIAERAPPRLDEALPITVGYWSRVRSAGLGDWVPQTPTVLSADEIEQQIFQWERFCRSMAAFMAEVDLVLSPVAARPAPLHGAFGREEYLYTLPWSLTRQPAAVVPFGASPEGLPIGVQLIARPWREDLALAAAMALEQSR
jgi:amidase